MFKEPRDHRQNMLGGLVLVFFCLLSLGQLQRIETALFPTFYIHELVIFLYMLVHLNRSSWRIFCWESIRRVPTLGKVCLGWVGAGLLAAATTQSLTILPFLYLGRFAFYVFALMTLALDLHTKTLSPTQVFKGLLTYFALSIYFGFLQYLFIPDLRFLFFLGWDDHYYRLTSTLLDPGFTGLIFVLGYNMALYMHAKTKNTARRFSSYTLLFLSLLAVLAIALTYSRASYLALGISLLGNLLIWWKKQAQVARFSLLMMVLFTVLVPVLPQPGGEGVNLARTSTIIARTGSAQAELKQVNTPLELILGQGLFVQDNIDTSLYSQTISHAKQPDSWLVLLLTGTGVVGAGLFLLLLMQFLRTSWRTSPFLALSLIAILVHGMFNASLTYPIVILLYGTWYVAAHVAHRNAHK